MSNWITTAQQRMTAQGNYSGPISGILGPLTIRGFMRVICRPHGIAETQTMIDLAEQIAVQLRGHPIAATRERFSRFLAECAIESNYFRNLVENMNYTTVARLRAVWPSRFPTNASAQPYVRNPQKLANFVYGGRMGNVNPNDGWDFRGRGIKHLTGRDNYTRAGNALGFAYAAQPDLVAQPEHAVRTAIWFWMGSRLNDRVDAGQLNAVSNLINTGSATRKAHALDERNAVYARLQRTWA